MGLKVVLDETEGMRLGAYLIPPSGDESFSLLIGDSVESLDDLSKESYDAFVADMKQIAKAWEATFDDTGYTWDDLVAEWVQDEVFGEDR